MKETNNKIKVVKHYLQTYLIKDLIDHKASLGKDEKVYIPFESPESIDIKDYVEDTLRIYVNEKPAEFKVKENDSKYYNYEVLVECETGDEITVDYYYETETSEWSHEFEKFLVSIGGLENGHFTGRDLITSRGICETGDGWLPIIKQLIIDLIDAGWDKQICQIKEKFGGLRFYINAGNDEIWKLISEAEKKSYETCEVCGKPGTQTTGGWISTLCEEHMK
jgi:hypothetical protein